jgi:hypothetical protein
LHIHFVSQSDAVYVSPHNGVEPNTAFTTHYYITYDGSVGGNKAIVAKFWKNTFYRENDRHTECGFVLL